MRLSIDFGDELACEARRIGHLCEYALVLLRVPIWRICLRDETRLLPWLGSTLGESAKLRGRLKERRNTALSRISSESLKMDS